MFTLFIFMNIDFCKLHQVGTNVRVCVAWGTFFVVTPLLQINMCRREKALALHKGLNRSYIACIFLKIFLFQWTHSLFGFVQPARYVYFRYVNIASICR